jgi:hypothetical protein
VAAEEIARLADRGKDVSRFFRGEGRMVQPIQRVNVDVTAGMLEEPDRAAQDLNVSRQAVIETLPGRLPIGITWPRVRDGRKSLGDRWDYRAGS